VSDWVWRRQTLAPRLSRLTAILEIADFGSVTRTGKNDPLETFVGRKATVLDFLFCGQSRDLHWSI
jgi:hypothetical protein